MSGFGVATAGVVALRRRPSHASEQVSQLLSGESFRVLRRGPRGEWLRVRSEADSYEGWVRAWHVVELNARAAAAWRSQGRLRVSALAAVVRRAPAGDAEALAQLPWGASLRPLGGRGAWQRVTLPDGSRGYVHGSEVTLGNPPGGPPTLAGIERTGEALLGVPYVWGGRSAWGMDCSGFVQAVLAWHGLALPRDAAEQARALGAVPWERAGREAARLPAGLLLFFGPRGRRISHVGLTTRSGDLLHALGRVRRDSLRKPTQDFVATVLSKIRSAARVAPSGAPAGSQKAHTP